MLRSISLPRVMTIPEQHRDSLERMKSYELAIQLIKAGWNDAVGLSRNHVMRPVSSQLYRALGSIGSNIAEGYSRSSGPDRVRFFEYALGSARESIVWYEASRPLLGPLVDERIALLVRVRSLLLATIPRDRALKLRPELKNPADRGALHSD